MQLKVNAAWLELIMAGWSALWSCSRCVCAPSTLPYPAPSLPSPASQPSPAPAPGAHTAWLGQPCSYSDMVEATMQYGLVLVVPESLRRLRSLAPFSARTS